MTSISMTMNIEIMSNRIFFVYPTCDDLASYPDYATDKKDLLLQDFSGYLIGISDTICNQIIYFAHENS